MKMNYKELVNEVTRLLDEFQEDKQCIDSFTEDTAKDLEVMFSDTGLFSSICILSIVVVVHDSIINYCNVFNFLKVL